MGFNGRRNYQRKDLNCGIREFDEETGYKKKFNYN